MVNADSFAQAISRGSEETLFTTSRAGRIIWWGHLAEMVFGYARVDTVGRSVLALAVAPPSVDGLSNAMQEAAERGAARCQVWFRGRDGRILDAPMDVRIERHANGAMEELVYSVGPPRAGEARIGIDADVRREALTLASAPAIAPAGPPAVARSLELEAHEALAASHEPAVMLLRITRLLVPALADSCRGYLLDAAGQPQRVAQAGVEVEDDAPLLSGKHAGDAHTLVIRLAARTRQLGAIVLRRRAGQRAPFDEDEARRAQALGRLVSLEIENARLIDMAQRARQESRRALDRADRLLHLSGALSGALTATQVADLVLEQARKLLRADGASIALLNDDRTRVEVVGTSGQVMTLFNAKRQFPVSAREPLADAARSGQPVYVESVRTGVTQYEYLANHASDGALVAVPLIVDNRSLGALGLRFPERREFSAEDRADMLALARHCSDAMDRVRLYDSERRARAESGEEARRLEVLADAGRLLASPLDHPGMLQTFAKSLVPGLADWCIIYATTRDDRLEPVAAHHREPARLSDLHEFAALEATEHAAPLGPTRVIKTARAQLLFQVPESILSGIAPDERRLRLLRAVGITSQMSLPLLARGRTLGVLVVSYAGFRRYSSTDVVFVEELARRMALALDNARLYKDAQESEERYRLLVEGVQDHAIFMLDTHGHVATWNPGAERLFGYTVAEALGAPYAALSLDDRAGGSVLDVVRVEGRHEDDGWCLRRGGGRFLGNRLVTRLTTSEGEHRGYAVIVRDLTERARAREALEKARAQLAATEKLSALGSLVSGVAHEIRTPLTVMSNNLHIMQMRISGARSDRPDDKLLESLSARVDEGIQGVDRLNRLVEDLRKFTRVKPGTRLRVPLETIVHDAVDLFSAAHRGQLEIKTTLEPTPPVEVDVVQVQQVVLNLLQNAADAVGGGSGAIHVETRKHERGACLVVADSGVGMQREVYSRMFEEFFTTKPQGTGLGLSIVRRIVESHKGSIECESEAGKGTRFTIVLPA